MSHQPKPGHDPGPPQGNRNAEFWTRRDVEFARQMLDLWASCKWSIRTGGRGVPTVDAVFERPVPTLQPWLDPRSGLLIADEEMHVPTSSEAALPPARVAELHVDHVLAAEGLLDMQGPLLRLYPRTGPYQRPPKEGRLGRGLEAIEREAIQALRAAERRLEGASVQKRR